MNWQLHNLLQEGEAPEVRTLYSAWRVAKDEGHTCDCCGQPIKRGEHYDYQALVIDGEFQKHYRHRRACWDE